MTQGRAFTDSQKWLARTLFDIGAVKTRLTDPEHPDGYRLKLHETTPDAPLSPLFFNLRTQDNPKPGPLGPEAVGASGAELYRLTMARELEFTAVAGIPNAGDPFAEAFVRASGNNYPLFRYGKKTEDNARRVIGLISGKPVPGEVQLCVDDLITQGHTKFEAIDAARASGIAVKDIVVLIDRQQGGAKQLADHGVKLHAVFPIERLLEFYVAEGKITEGFLHEVMFYLAANS
jgi:orotate phosphoribosyltransferase